MIVVLRLVRMILHGFWRSSATWRARIALSLKGCTYEYRPVNLTEGQQHLAEYRAMNPMGQVPLLEVTEEDGRTVQIAQSLVIAEYLEERFPSPPLLPGDRVARAHVRQIAETINSGIQPLVNTIVRNFVRDELKADDRAWCRHWIGRGLNALELMLSSPGPYAAGATPTLADVCIVPQLYLARRFDLDVAAHPKLAEIEQACQKLAAFSATHPALQIDAPRA